MAVGKPDFNLNSYGIKYFQKGEDSIDEVDESRDDIKVDSKIGGISVPKRPQTPKEIELSDINNKLNSGNTKITHNTGASRLRQQKIPKNPNNEVNIKDLEQDKKITNQAAPKPKHTKDTKYVFNAEQDPKSLSISQQKLLQDANEARPKNPKPDPITGIKREKRRDYPTQGVIANSANVTSGEEGGRTEDITEVPDPRKRGGHKKELMNVGRTRPKGYTEPAKDIEERKRLSDKEKPDEKKEKEVKEKETRQTKDIPKKMGSRMVGNAPKEIPEKNTTEQVHSGKKVTVGVGSKAKEVFDKKEGVGAVHDESELKTRPTGVVAKPDKELNTITSTENKRLRDHRNEMNKFLSNATPAQAREYTAIKNRKNEDGSDGGEDYDAQRTYVRNITGKESKTQEKVTQTKEEKESERKLEHADRMVDMKERDKRIKRDAWKEDEEFHKKIEEDGKTWQGKKQKEDKEFHGIDEKEGKVSTIASKPKDKKPIPKDNPNALKPRKEENEPDKITTDDIDDKISAIATQLAQIKDPKERAKKRLELSGQKEADKSKKEIEAAKKRVEAAKKKVEAGKKKKETAKKKKETAKKKKVVPKEGQLTPAQIKAYRAERQAKKDTVAKSNDIIATMNILKLDLMNKKDDWDKNERENERRSRGGGGSPDYNKIPFGVKQDMLHGQAVQTGRSGKGLKGKKINPKNQTFGEDAEEYGKIYDRQNETLKSQAEETIFKAISLKLDLAKDL